MQQRLQQGAAQVLQSIVEQSSGPDDSYKREYNIFKEWVEKQKQNGDLPATQQVLSRETVDLYFTEVIVFRDIAASSAKRITYALQWYVKNTLPQGQRFTVVNDAVNDALEAQKL